MSEIEEIKESYSNCNLELGDIIEIYADDNEEFHKKTFYITYIDDNSMNLININNNLFSLVKFDESGNIKDESIQKIIIISRSEEKGYAKQHMLLPKTWIDIHFNGEIAEAFTGEITNLEEDMIEITRFPNLDVFYIDFGYKGIAEDLHIEKIVIRSKPAPLEKIESLINVRERLDNGADIESVAIEDNNASMEYLPSGESIITIPEGAEADKTFKEQLHGLYSSANEIVYGKDLDDLVGDVEIPENKKRHGIDTQVNDMLDVMLSKIPNRERTDRVKNEIHMLIQRFRELRDQYTKFDEYRNVITAKQNGIGHKPLLNNILEFKKKLKWVLPVVALKKKLYDEDIESNDVDVYTSDKVIIEEDSIQESYIKNQLVSGDESLYTNYYNKINDYYVPYKDPDYTESYIGDKITIHDTIEGIIDNLEDFHSTVIGINNNKIQELRKQFVSQTYIQGNSYLEPKISKTGNKIYVRKQITNNEEITLKSLMFLPTSLIHFSKIDLPETSLLDKCNLSSNFIYLFKILNSKTSIDSRVIDDFDQDTDKEFWEIPLNDNSFVRNPQHYILNESLDQSTDKFEQYLNSIIPESENIIRLFEKLYSKSELITMMSVRKSVEKLEPFLIYLKDISYTQYNAIRFFIKNYRKGFLERLSDKKDEMNRFLNSVFNNSTPFPNKLESIFNEKKNLLDIVVNLYNVTLNKSSTSTNYTSSYEWLSKIKSIDNGTVFNNIIRLLMVSLITPENLLNAINDDITNDDDMNKYEKIKASDCIRHILTKKYNSLKDLQKDNGNEDIYYDEQYDDTPYEIMNNYKDEKKKFTPDELKEFLEESLVQKHDCPPKLAPEMASSLIEGKKLIHEGEYALLELLPHFSEKNEESEFSTKEKEDLVDQSKLLKKTAYYKRVNDQWIHDNTVDDTVFYDNNTLFCNMSKICFKNTKNNVCESVLDTKERLKKIQRKQLIDEFDERFADSYNNIEETLRQILDNSIKENKALKRLDEVKLHKANDYAYSLGKYAKELNTNKSPYLEQLELIIGQEDFVKKQDDIVKFAELYCRDPMVSELNESMYWLYCTETNTQLLPMSIYQLARAFVSNENYMEKLDELCRKQGRIEGNKIVDNYSGRLLRNLDFIDEDVYDEQGFKLISNEVIEKDPYENVINGKDSKKNRVFDNEDTELIYKLYKSIISHIGIKTDGIEEFVLRVSLELLNDPSVVKGEKLYKREAKEIEDKQAKRKPPYEIYRNKLIIFIVTSVILIGIQTTTPSFKIQKTFPGCTQSFKGFPENEGAIEDTTGIDYLVCILNTIKTKSSKPWNSIKPLPIHIIKSQMMLLIKEAILTRNDINELYLQKQEYLFEHPDEDIPNEHAIQKWYQFMPPVFAFSISKKLNGIPSGYKDELLQMQKTANKLQTKQLNMFKTKCMQFTYAIIENINKVINNKGLLLKTSSGSYYTENSCCNDKKTIKSMDYFTDENNELIVYLRMIHGWSKILNSNKILSTPSILYHAPRSGITYLSDLDDSHFEKNVYIAFILYCNLDNDKPIPEDLQVLIPEKIADYPRHASLIEKIDFLKSNGKKFSNTNLLQLMEIVNNRNIIESKKAIHKDTRIDAIQDIFNYYEDKNEDDDIVLTSKFRTLFGNVLKNYNSKKMVAEDSEETYKLNNWLTHANTNLLERITSFISQNSKLKNSQKSKLEEQLANVHIWNMDSTYEHGNNINQKDETTMYSVTQFMRKSIYLMTRVYPEMIINNSFPSTASHKNWNFADLHNKDISAFIENYYSVLKPFTLDRPLSAVLKHIQEVLIDINTFIGLIPIFLPIHRKPEGELEAQSYYSLFTKRTLYMIYSYIWYSVLYEYIKATDNDELINMDIILRKESQRNLINEVKEYDKIGESVELYNDTSFDFNSTLAEVEIDAGNKEQLKQRVCDLIITFINLDNNNKKIFDLSYSDIEKRITRSKINEKKMITDFLKNMDDDQRRVEDTMKMLKLGRWNVGLRKGHVEYDQQRYKEERSELFQQLAMNPSEANREDVIIQRNVEEIENDEQNDADEMYDEEANDLRDYYGTDADGAYYEEDRDDFGED